MLIKKLLQTRRADAKLPLEIRAALVESLFAPIASLIVGAVACSIIGAAVALRVGDEWIMANSVAIFAVGMLRVVSALLYRQVQEDGPGPAATKRWEHVYEYGAWGFAALLGLLCWLTITQTNDGAAADGGHDDRGRLRRRNFRPQRRAAFHRRRPAHLCHAADGDRAARPIPTGCTRRSASWCCCSSTA